MLHHKKIILGITGGIAAYKCPHLVRLLVKEGAEVKVILSPGATDFVTPQTLAVVSKNEVLTGFFDNNHNWNNHVHLAEWADLLVIAPLTANTLAKMSSGVCDNVLLATYLSFRNKTIVAPAMDLEMYRHSTVKANLEQLKAAGNLVIPAESGELASGLSGEGRMAEPEHIVSFLKDYFSSSLPLKGRKALVNAGPTHEAIDPVRYIGNRSSGKMGVAVAETLSKMGARVTLVTGPGAVESEDRSIVRIKVENSDEMYQAMLMEFAGQDIVVCSAAVADYKPARPSAEKIKKKDEKLALDLVRTKDILAELGKQKQKQCLVGFALETSDLEKYALEKLKSKNLDMVVANAANESGSGIGADSNRIIIIDRHNKITKFELKSKREAAADIVTHIIQLLSNP